MPQYNKLNPEDINPDSAAEILADMISDMSKSITLNMITQQVCRTYNLEKQMLMDKSRKTAYRFPATGGDVSGQII